MFNLFKKYGTGALLDTRTSEEKLSDYTQRELVASVAAPVFPVKTKSEVRSFPVFNQGSSNSCVANTAAKLLGIMLWLKNGEFVRFSATHIYQRRANKPYPGMNGIDAFTIAREGVTLEQLVKSEQLTDQQMDEAKIEQYKKDVASVFKLGNYLQIDARDFNAVASTIEQTGKGVMVWFYFNSSEWSREFPQVQDSLLSLTHPSTLRHSVTAVDTATINGEQVLVIEDSAHFGGLSRRFINRAFFEARNYFAAYPINFKFDEQTSKPVYRFGQTLTLGMQNEDVKALQDVLKYELLFPSNTASSGYYGSVTAKAVLAFQRKYAVASESELTQLAGGTVGSKTIAKLNELYGQ